MKTVRSINALRRHLEAARRRKKTIGFVPTMGYLHEGHLSLIRRCRKDTDLTVLSIFVNPAQFSPDEDYRQYPRDKKRDEILAKKEKVDIIFYPSAKTMYPTGYLTYVVVEKITDRLCGRTRPGHFRGVCTVVAKLLNIVSPDAMYLGQKDFQQALVLKRMVRDLNFPTTIKVLPIVREPDGLAMSSRNRYLSPQQRREATVLYQSLKTARQAVRSGERDPGRIKTLIRQMIREKSSARIDYIECVEARTLATPKRLRGTTVIALAAWFGPARLIDNIIARVS